MKVLMIHCSYKYKGGEDTVVAEEMALLRSNETQVELLEFNNDKNVFLKLLQLPFNFGAYYKTKKKIKSFKPDVVHIHNLHFGASPSVLYAIKKSRIPFVMTLHNYRLLCPSAILFHRGKPFLSSIRQSFPWQAVKAGVYKNSRLLTLWLAFSMQLHQWFGTWKMCNRFIVLTQNSRTLFLDSKMNFKKKQVVVKPNFSSLSHVASYINAGYFLYVGRLSEEKGIRLLLEVFSACSFQLKIAGDGPLKNEVVNYSSRFDNIEFLGSLEKEKVFALMNECNALVFPSIWYEGMPLTIIEAFASGVPVIASKLGAMENMITSGYDGFHFSSGSKEDFVEKINDWQKLPDDEKQTYRQNARKTYEELYTPEKNAVQLLAIYNSVRHKSQVKESMVSAALSLTQS